MIKLLLAVRAKQRVKKTKRDICIFYKKEGYELITFDENNKNIKTEKLIDEYDCYARISREILGTAEVKSKKLQEQFVKKIKQMKKVAELYYSLGKDGQAIIDQMVKLKQK